jgi:hypothetical protein
MANECRANRYRADRCRQWERCGWRYERCERTHAAFGKCTVAPRLSVLRQRYNTGTASLPRQLVGAIDSSWSAVCTQSSQDTMPLQYWMQCGSGGAGCVAPPGHSGGAMLHRVMCGWHAPAGVAAGWPAGGNPFHIRYLGVRLRRFRQGARESRNDGPFGVA